MAKSKGKNKNKALDSNIIINLYDIYNGIAPNYYHQDKDYLLSIYHIYDLVENSEFKFFITPAVFDEIKQGVEKYGHDAGIYQFIADMGISLATIPDELQEECNTLRQTYLGKNRQNSYLGKAFTRENASDAQIMAEATVLGLDVITNNTKHFIGGHQNNSSIKNRILRINNELGYTQGIPNSSLEFLQRRVQRLFDKHGKIDEHPKSLYLAPLEEKKKTKHHKNKYAEHSKVSNPEGIVNGEEPKEYHSNDLDNLTHYHPEDFPKAYRSPGHICYHTDYYPDDELGFEPPTND